MAKKRQKTTRFSIQSYDAAHYRQTEQYTQVVDALFDRATTEIARAAAKGTYDPDKPFSFDDYPSVKSVMQNVTAQLATRMVTVIETGSKKQWLFACDKNDGFIESIMNTSKLSKARLKKMQDRNLEALQTFQKRKVEGMNLSQRVWKYVGQYQAQLESALDVGLGEGRSAAQLSRDVRENLKEPNRLFRRVRDKRGNLVLSKAAKAFHPGQGVYRSSYKNAMRLTRSEINMAYRESDFLRWQSLDFVVGFEIRRSNHEPLCKCDLCSKLVGRYPKTFKFKGWHPQCMCFAVPILMDEETFDENELGDLKAALNGTQYKKLEAKNLVTDVPDGFKQWAKDHEEAQKNWSSTPYFIKDNFKNGKLSEGLKIDLPTLSKAEVVQAIVRFEAKTPQEAIDYIINNVADGCTLKITPKDLPLVNQIINQVVERMQQFGIPKFKNIGVCASRKAQASWTDDNELNFNLSQLKPEKIWSLNEAWAKRGVKWSHYESIEDTIRATIDHEIGHRLYMQYSMGNATREAFAKAAVTRNGFNEMNEVLGYYASTEEQEYFAEAFARWMGKGRSGVVGYTKALMEELMAKVAPKQADVLAPYRTQIAQARQQATKWGLSVQLTMLDKYVAEKNIASIQSRIATIQQKANEMAMVDADIRRKCAEWGLNTYILDEAMLKPDSKNILAKISELENRVRDAEKEYKAFISDATNAINEARKYKVDISEMLADVATITGDKREWIMGKASYKKALQDFLDKISNAKGSTPTSKQMPDELKAKSTYLNGEDYTFDKDFFDLIDPNKPIRLEILDSDSGSYSSFVGNLVHIAGKKRGAKSPWECKSVIYHEYGHCIDAQRSLWTDSKLIDMRTAQIKILKKKREYTLYERKWNHEKGGWYHERVTKTMSMVEYVDTKLQQLQEKIWGMKDDVFTKRGITKWDVLEQIGSTRDTIKSLVVKFGSGHSTSYFKKTRMSETEYLAHAFENAFLGNRVFQKYLPDIYKEMIAYIKALKPIK